MPSMSAWRLSISFRIFCWASVVAAASCGQAVERRVSCTPAIVCAELGCEEEDEDEEEDEEEEEEEEGEEENVEAKRLT